MKKGLNVNAAVYVPLSERVAAGENKNHNPLKAEGSETKKAPVGFGSHPTNPTPSYYPSKSSQIYHPHGSYYPSSSKSPNMDPPEDILGATLEMDLEYLMMLFPDYSEESLSHMYLLNQADLDSTVDMLDQLELCPEDSPELPDSLEIGDTSDSQSSKKGASLIPKKVEDDIPSSSGVMNQPPLPK